ncbi:hypothetical protein K1719_043294 [Acacia pycnantha]|nr:hypothetical protein K1719_043294 [Acacia pycnantha]
MSRPGDWTCRSCQHLNFQRRDMCQRCGESKYGDLGFGGGRMAMMGSSFGFSSSGNIGTTGSDVRPGDWYCSAANCGAHNFASRSSCFKCGAFKDDFSSSFSCSRPFASSASSRPSWKSGDWICNRSGCNEHNFASRMECFKCSAPRDTY